MVVRNRNDVVMDAGSARALAHRLHVIDQEDPDDRLKPLELRVRLACMFRRSASIVRFKLIEGELDLILEALGHD